MWRGASGVQSVKWPTLRLWLRSLCQGPGIKPHVELCAQQEVCFGILSLLRWPFPACSFSLSLSQNK